VESVTVTVTVDVPLDDGVPLITPEVELMLRPPGSPVALKNRGEFPPLVPTVTL
jgi:hypothetical protein